MDSRFALKNKNINNNARKHENMDLIYLDYNCFQRGFDDIGQIRILIEALACQEIFLRAKNKKITLVWSFMHQDEATLCPFVVRKYQALSLASLCAVKIAPNQQEILELAKKFQQNVNLSAKDALHIACAVYIKVDYFLSCDDKLIKQAKKLNISIGVMNPVDYIRMEKS